MRHTAFNQCGVLSVNPAKHPQTKAAEAQKFVDWVTSPAGQAVIAGYKINGEQLFFPNARNKPCIGRADSALSGVASAGLTQFRPSRNANFSRIKRRRSLLNSALTPADSHA